MPKAIFGRPIPATAQGGAHVSVDIITLHKGKIVLFEKPDDRWFPCDFLEYGESPEVAAKRVLKQWGKVEPKHLNLVEVFSMVPPGEDWKLAFEYVAELKGPAKPGANIKSVLEIEPNELPRMVGWLRRSDIKRYLSLAEGGASKEADSKKSKKK